MQIKNSIIFLNFSLQKIVSTVAMAINENLKVIYALKTLYRKFAIKPINVKRTLKQLKCEKLNVWLIKNPSCSTLDYAFPYEHK